MDLLVCLAERPGSVVSHQEIFDRVWAGAFVVDVALKRNISTLRRALRDDASNPRYIRTIRKRGYQWIETVVPLEQRHATTDDSAESDTSRQPIRSVAVLPFDDLSGDPEQLFFADGMTDVLISNLAGIRALKVISRTSTMQYKEREKPIPVAARELATYSRYRATSPARSSSTRITSPLTVGMPNTSAGWRVTTRRSPFTGAPAS